MLQKTKGVKRLASILAVTLFASGCTKRTDIETSVFTDTETEQVVTVVLDLSGSFVDQMANNGKGYEFALRVIDRYFRDRIGTQAKLVIAQISGSERALLWEGTPMQLRKDFPTAEAFRDFLLQKADPSASRVGEGIARAIDYIMADSCVANGKAKSGVFVLSDLVENSQDAAGADEHLDKALAAYGKSGGMIGVYFVDQLLVSAWRNRLQASGCRFHIEADINQRPTLPSFD